MKVKILVPCTIQGVARKPGEVVELPDGLAKSVIRAGRAVEVKEKGKPKREKAVKEPSEKAAKEPSEKAAKEPSEKAAKEPEEKAVKK